jgi:SAM-dependent methyltransferase
MNLEITARELAKFLNIDLEECMRRLKEYTVLEAADIWKESNPKTAEDVERFYKDKADYYLYELTNWNCTNEVYQSHNAPLLGYHGKKILEIGAGIGTLCIQLAYAGNDVTYCDINPKLRAFAKQRFEDRGLYISIVTDLKNQRDFDIIIANDFFEHIHKDALPKLLKQIATCLRDQGFVYHRSNFKQQDIFPMHFDHSEYFVKQARDANLIVRANGDLVKGGESRGVQIGVPMLGPMTDEWFYSFIGLDKPPGTKLTKVSSRPADEARNMIIKQLEKDWLFFMDADQTFHPDTLRKLLSWDLPIVSGLYFKSPGNPVPHAYKYAYQEAVGEQKDTHFYAALIDPVTQFLLKHTDKLKNSEAIVLPSTKEDLLEVDGVGAGCILVHRQVLDAIEPPWFEYNKESFVGEDFYFCRKVQAAGFKIFLDPGVICGHRMKAYITAEHFLNFITTKGKKLEGVYQYPWKEPGE